MGDDAIHQGHCTQYQCVYYDPQCPKVTETLPGGKAEEALATLQKAVDEIYGTVSTEFLVRATDTGWVYALPKILPKFLAGKRGTQECAEWHRRQIAGPDPEDWTGFEIVKRPVGPWEVVT